MPYRTQCRHVTTKPRTTDGNEQSDLAAHLLLQGRMRTSRAVKCCKTLFSAVNKRKPSSLFSLFLLSNEVHRVQVLSARVPRLDLVTGMGSGTHVVSPVEWTSLPEGA